MSRIEDAVKKAEEAVRDGGDGLREAPREAAAEMLKRTGDVIQKGSKRVGAVTEKTGARIARRVKQRAEDIRTGKRRGIFGYIRRHPLQAVLFLGLMSGVLAVVFLPRLGSRREAGEFAENGDYGEFGPMA